jgi:hypothetical protein
VNYDEFVAAVAEAGAGLAPAPQGAGRLGSPRSDRSTCSGSRSPREAPSGDAVADQRFPKTSPPDGRSTPTPPSARRPPARSRGVRADCPARRALAPAPGYVVNLALGQLSEQGEFDHTVRHATHPRQSGGLQQPGGEPWLMMHAHGGLVSEHFALEHADKMVPWWLSRGQPLLRLGVGALRYPAPVRAGPPRRVRLYQRSVWEGVLKSPGSLAWSAMKKSARLSRARTQVAGIRVERTLFADQLAERHAGGALGKLRVPRWVTARDRSFTRTSSRCWRGRTSRSTPCTCSRRRSGWISSSRLCSLSCGARSAACTCSRWDRPSGRTTA